jgi:hypothetical protein
MKAEWMESGILQLEPESIEDVFKLADFVKSLETMMLKRLRLSLPCKDYLNTALR